MLTATVGFCEPPELPPLAQPLRVMRSERNSGRIPEKDGEGFPAQVRGTLPGVGRTVGFELHMTHTPWHQLSGRKGPPTLSRRTDLAQGEPVPAKGSAQAGGWRSVRGFIAPQVFWE